MDLDVEEINGLIEQFEKDSKALKQEILEVCWHMRGALSYSEGLELSFDERQLINDIIKTHLETTQKTGLPYF